MTRKLIASRIQTPDGTILESKFTHDFVSYKDKNGEIYILDGGTEYVRKSINNEPSIDMSIYSDDSWDICREYIYRGTFDENGYRIWKKLSECSIDHLYNIIEYNKEHCLEDTYYNSYILKEIEYRNYYNINN